MPAVKVKICGLKTVEMLDAAIGTGADYVGLVHFAPSPRHVDLAEAARLAGHARGRTRTVLLLVDPDDGLLERVGREVAPDFIQLHGSETPARVRAATRLGACPAIKAIKVETAADAAEALAYREVADIILFDAKAPKALANTGAVLPGGNGLAFDWRALAGVTPQLGAAWMLSGGLDPANVAEAIRLTGAPAVDVSSGVETAPGEKSADLIRRFLQAVKPAKQQA